MIADPAFLAWRAARLFETMILDTLPNGSAYATRRIERIAAEILNPRPQSQSSPLTRAGQPGGDAACAHSAAASPSFSPNHPAIAHPEQDARPVAQPNWQGLGLGSAGEAAGRN